uniref:Protein DETOXIFICATION n=1 Tax=Salix viminalis TaxID=40686 RepID=A0A6N2NHF0_SALVM
MVAFVNLGSYYVIGLPVGILLGYVAHLQVTGLWVGLLSGVVVQTLLLSYLTWRIDWEEQVNKASERLVYVLLSLSLSPSLSVNKFTFSSLSLSPSLSPLFLCPCEDISLAEACFAGRT